MTCNIDWNRRHLKEVTELQISEEITNKELVTEFHLCFNFIASVPLDALCGFSNLTYLSLNCNNLTTVPSLIGTPTLKELHLANNKISKIENLECVPGLEHLNLRCNHIQCISNLAMNTQLQELYLSGNLLSTIDWDTLPDFHHLTTLGLYSNQFIDFKSVLVLIVRMSKLRRVYLGCNPFSDGSPLTLRSVLLNMKHLEASQIAHFVTQLKLCVSSLDFTASSQDVLNVALRATSLNHALQDPLSFQNLVQVLHVLGCLKSACPSLVSVDGDPLFSAVFVQSDDHRI